jgi:hypothetical protein
VTNRISAFGWTIELAPGWRAEVRHETLTGETTAFLAILPKANDALLRLTPDERGIMAAAEWVELVGRNHRCLGRIVSALDCGDFSGNVVEFNAGDEWIRGWALCSDSVPVDATYRCKATEVGRDDAAVDKMLSTLCIEAAYSRDKS